MRLILGCGYVGHRVARLGRDAGHEVSVVTRSTRRAAEFEREGLHPIVADVTCPESLDGLPTSEAVLFAVGFDRSAGPTQRAVYVDGLAAVLDRVADRTERFVHVSSSSVYGQGDGSWVDEDSPTEPNREGGRLCLEAEQLVGRAFPEPHRAVVLRLAGIYGPGRLLRRVESLHAADPIAGNPDAWLNLIHVADAVRVVDAALRAEHAAERYLVCDDEPVVRRRYFERLAEVVGAPPPRFDPAADSRHGSGGLNKRCRNMRVRGDLGVDLAYPSFATGLTDAVATRTVE